jgi:acyl carrier protein phosphodiesterase
VNWLAHLYLTAQTPEGWLGALLGDVVRGAPPASLGSEITAAIALHRRIDALTATHPAVRRSCARVDAGHGHYRRVIVDLFYDHVLARTWGEWAREPLPAFLTRALAGVDGLLQQQPALTPPFYPPMRQQAWLSGYAEVAGIEAALRGMRRRLRRDHPIDEAVRDLARARDGFTADFRWLFRDAIAHAATLAALPAAPPPRP